MTAKMTGQSEGSSVSWRIFSALALVAGLGLAGCADVDSMLFGDSETAPDESQSQASPAPAPTSYAKYANVPVTSGSTAAPVATITPVSIEPGSDTGTAVSKSIASLRSQVSGLQGSLAQNAQRLADLRNSGAESVAAYHEAKDQITATFNVSGAVDEDHRQLSVLEDETNQTIVLIDRLLTEVSGSVQRQTAYVANERANLTVLNSAIKSGELYGADLGTSAMSASATGSGNMFAYSGTPLVVIRFDHRDVDYQQILYAALNQALQTRPGAAFAVVAVSPTRGTATAVQLAQTAAHRHAQEVMRTMTDMGVMASRLTAASATDPAATSSEVRVFVR
jgi:hypothetical protein